MAFDVVEYLNHLVKCDGDVIADIASPSYLPINWRIEYEERAAILQWDGGLSRKDADIQALQEINARLRDTKRSEKDYT